MIREGQLVAASSLTQVLRDRARIELESEMSTPTRTTVAPEVLLSPISVEIQRAEADLLKATKKINSLD